MTTDPLQSPAMRERLARLRAALEARPISPDDVPDEAPPDLYRG